MWGFLAGCVVGGALAAVTGGLLWVFVVGDAPPPGREKLFVLVPIIGILALGAVIAVGAALGVRHGKTLERVDDAALQRRHRKRAFVLLTGTIVTLAILGSWSEGRRRAIVFENQQRQQ